MSDRRSSIRGARVSLAVGAVAAVRRVVVSSEPLLDGRMPPESTVWLTRGGGWAQRR
jgi:hypothetical protein